MRIGWNGGAGTVAGTSGVVAQITALGAGMWNTGLAAAGYLLGEHWHGVIAAIDYWEEVILLVGAAGVVGLLAGRRILANRSALRHAALTANTNLRDAENTNQL